jgi:hypothetical protein
MYCIKSLSFLKAASSTPPPNLAMPSRARSRNCSIVHPDLATPIMGTFRTPSLIILCRAGKIFLWARSPVAPKKTNASERLEVVDAMEAPLGSQLTNQTV